MKYNQYVIEAFPLHKEICTFLIDNHITFHCYNAGLKAIVIDSFSPYRKEDFINEIMKIFNLKLERELKGTYFYESIE